jgi:hypothetical protein
MSKYLKFAGLAVLLGAIGVLLGSWTPVPPKPTHTSKYVVFWLTFWPNANTQY